MKQPTLVSMIGALVVMISAVVCITACQQANGNTADTSGNTENSLAVQPTGEAAPELAETNWETEDKATSMFFYKKGNTAIILATGTAVYTLTDAKISFDLSSWITIYKTITVAQHIQNEKAKTKGFIADLEEQIETETDAAKKNKLQKDLESLKQYLRDLDNPSTEMSNNFPKVVQGFNKRAAALESHAKFEGVFNTDKTELTIEHFPFYTLATESVTVKKIVFKKRGI